MGFLSDDTVYIFGLFQSVSKSRQDPEKGGVSVFDKVNIA